MVILVVEVLIATIVIVSRTRIGKIVARLVSIKMAMITQSSKVLVKVTQVTIK